MLGSFLLLANLSVANQANFVQKAEFRITPFTEALAAFDGIWLKDTSLGEGWSDCIYAVRIQAQDSLLHRVVACADGRTQVEMQPVTESGLAEDSSWSPKPGLFVITVNYHSSCANEVSFFGSGQRYAFDQSLSSGGAELSFFMTTDIGEEKANFRSGATYPALGKNKRCDVLVRRAQQEFQKGNKLLQTVAKACLATIASSGCFTSDGTFIPTAEGGL